MLQCYWFNIFNNNIVRNRKSISFFLFSIAIFINYLLTIYIIYNYAIIYTIYVSSINYYITYFYGLSYMHNIYAVGRTNLFHFNKEKVCFRENRKGIVVTNCLIHQATFQNVYVHVYKIVEDSNIWHPALHINVKVEFYKKNIVIFSHNESIELEIFTILTQNAYA